MTVRQLLERLQSFPMTAEVVLPDALPVGSVSTPDGRIVVLDAISLADDQFEEPPAALGDST